MKTAVDHGPRPFGPRGEGVRHAGKAAHEVEGGEKILPGFALVEYHREAPLPGEGELPGQRTALVLPR